MIRAHLHLQRSRLSPRPLGLLGGLGLLFLASVPTYAQFIGTNEVPDLPASAGGAGQPDPFTGAMTYRLPLTVLPGRHGMQPDLALVYRSSNPNDPTGHGWKLELGMIERNKRISANDPNFFTLDLYTFRLGGVTQDLVRVSDPPNPPAGFQGEYRAVIEGAFTRFWRIRHLDPNDPPNYLKDYWEATDRFGRTVHFGYASPARVTQPSDPAKIYEWMMDRRQDPQGNTLTVTYTAANGRAYLQEIAYAGHPDGPPTTKTIAFYTQMGGDGYTIQFPDYILAVGNAQLYKTIVVSNGGTPVRAYALSYNPDGTSPRRLTQVQEYGKDVQLDGSGNITGGTTLPAMTFTYTTAADPGGANLLKTVANGYGAVTTMTYQTLTLTAPSDAYDALVTQSVQVEDGRGQSGTTTYHYTGGFYKASVREFRGFGVTTIAGPQGPSGPNEQRITDLWFLQGNGTGGAGGGGDDPTVATSVMRGKPYRIKVSDPTGKVYSDGLITYGGTPGSCTTTCFNPPASVTTTYSSGRGRTTRTVYTYDGHGNIIREDQYGDDTSPSPPTTDDRTILRTFQPNLTAWIVGLPAQELVYSGTYAGPPPSSALKAATYLCYDWTGTCHDTTVQSPTVGNLTKRTQLLSPGVLATTTLSYDIYGNLISLIDPNDSDNERTYLYDATATYLLRAAHPRLSGTLYKAEICTYHVDTTYYGVTKAGDPGSATTPCSPIAQVLPPNPGLPATGFYGQPALIRDENEKDTTVEYDALGRPTKATRPDNSYTTTQYLNFGAVNQQEVRREEYESGAVLLRQTRVFFDGLGRTYETRTTGPDSQTIRTQTTFDARGQVAAWPLPAFVGDPVRTQTFTYDPLGRLSTTGSPDGSTTRACYDDWITVTVDANGHQRRETRDAFARVIMLEEDRGATGTCTLSPGTAYATTQYEYDVLDNLTKVTDAQNNETTFSYDAASRRTQLVAPDTGTTTATYHPAGQLLTQTDAKGQTTGQKIWLDRLDRWSRPFQKDFGTSNKPQYFGDVNYRYDENGRNGFGRLTAVIENAATVNLSYDPLGRISQTVETVSGTPYTTEFTYDGLGRLKTVTYPDSSVVTYSYNGPFLASVTEGATPYATFSGYNALGQPGVVTFGNGVTTTLTYHDQNFRLLRRLTTKAGSTYQDMRYGYDPGGNVTAIVDPIFGTQSFRYDDLDRLISASRHDATGSVTETRPFGYDSIGNLTLHCTLGDLAYPASGAGSVRPHAVCATGTTSCASPTYQYDANGNLTSNPTLSSLVYDFENRPTFIAKSGGATTTFTYSDLLGRVTKTASGTTTTYVGPWYECVGGTCTKYVFAGDQRIAKKVGAIVTYYHPDHLGSTSLLTNTSGGLDQKNTYYPFGDKRTLTDGNNNPIDPGDRYKYTDQEFDDTAGLYFYQARYYDQAIGRFIQPDSIVPNLYDPQALNPYSYVLNNPLRYTDPSGYQAGEFCACSLTPQVAGELLNSLVQLGLQNKAQPFQASPALYSFVTQPTILPPPGGGPAPLLGVPSPPQATKVAAVVAPLGAGVDPQEAALFVPGVGGVIGPGGKVSIEALRVLFGTKIGAATIEQIFAGARGLEETATLIQFELKGGLQAAKELLSKIAGGAKIFPRATSKGVVESVELEGGASASVRAFSKPPLSRPTLQIDPTKGSGLPQLKLRFPE